MRKSIYLFIVAMFFTGIAIGQNSIGIKTGFNFANIGHSNIGDLEEFTGTSYQLFWTIGGVYKRKLDDNWSISSGLNYTRRGTETKLNKDIEIYGKSLNIGARLEHRMDYLELPVLFEYRIKSDDNLVSPYIIAGANFGYETKYNILVKTHFVVDVNLFNYDVNLNNNTFNRFDISGVIGAGVYIPLVTGSLNFDMRYLQGITDIMDKSIIDLDLMHRNFRFGMSYLYTLKSK